MKVGIWLDTKEAFIIGVTKDAEKVKHVSSDIESFRPVGGSRSNVVYGPVDTVSESKYNEKRKHQEVNYFDEIIADIDLSKQIMLFGPAEIKNKLKKRIEARSELGIEVLDCLTADSITDNQKVAFVRDYYDISKG